MKATVIKNTQVGTKEYGVLRVQELMNSSDNENLSISIVEISGQNTKVKNVASDMFYLVMSGIGTFLLDAETHEVTVGDLVVIPKNTPYQDSGKMKLLAIATPRFKPENVETKDV